MPTIIPIKDLITGTNKDDWHHFTVTPRSKEQAKELRDAFREFSNYPCPFKDCFHTNEKECSIKKAVNDNNILESRYENYLSFLKEVNK